MGSPKVSVIIPCYNGERFIKNTLESVLMQTYDNFEILFVDDGSTDKTKEVISSFSDSRLKYFYQNNKGVSEARNYGIKLSSGEYIALLDTDDLWDAEKLESQVRRITEDKSSFFVYSNYCIIDENNAVTEEVKLGKVTDALRSLLLKGNVIGPPSGVLVKREIFRKAGGFDPCLSVAADWDMWIRIASKYPLTHLEEVLFKYRRHSNNMHLNLTAMEHDVGKIFDKFFRSLCAGDALNKIRKKAIFNLYMVIVKSYFKKKEFNNCFKAMLTAFCKCCQRGGNA